MEKYTREQLIKAQHKYNNQFVDNPDEFKNNPDWKSLEPADSQIDYLLSLIDA